MTTKDKVKLNEIDALTLSYLADYNLINENKEQIAEPVSKKDLNFYRKRLINLFKERTREITKYAKNEKKDILDDLILKLVIESIKYFKHEDYHDLQQEELAGIDVSGLDQVDSLPIEQENYNEILYSKPEEKQNTLDNFVNVKSIKIKEKPINYPKLNKHNLTDENLKYKGIKNKKKQEKNGNK